MSDVKHEPQCAIAATISLVAGDPVPNCTCGAERIAELEAQLQASGDMIHGLSTRCLHFEDRAHDLEAKLTHLRNLIASHEGKATSLVEEIRRGLEE